MIVQIKSKFFYHVILVWMVVLLFQSVAFSQTGLARIRGAVSDQSGAVLPGLTLTLTDTQTGASRTTLSTDAGTYEIPDVKPGNYRLTVAHTGFSTFVADNIIVNSGEIRQVNAVLQIGDTASEVTVNASAAVIQPEDTKIAGSVNKAQVQNAPLVGHDYLNAVQFLASVPGVVTYGSSFNASFMGVTNQIQEGMDGVATDGLVNQINNMLNVDEVNVIAGNNSAEYARAGYYNLVGARGSNSFHGKGYLFLQNSVLNARDFFAPSKPSAKYITDGADFSGPVIRNRTFFYLSYTGLQDPSTSYVTGSTPSSAMRTGDFSQFLSLTTPTSIKDPLTGIAFPNNVIPANRINPVALKIQQAYIPEPNLGSPSTLTNNMSFLWPYSSDQYRADYMDVRVDHRISNNNDFYAGFSQRYSPYALAGSWPLLGWTRNRHHMSIVANDTYTLSPTKVLDLRFGGVLDRQVDGGENHGFQPINGKDAVATIGLEGVNSQNLSAAGFPSIGITGYNTLSVNPAGTQSVNTLSYAGALTWVDNRHTWKFGSELRTFSRLDSSVPTGSFGSFTFTGIMSGSPYADFLLGLPRTSTRLDPLTNRTTRGYELGIFAEDTFKITPKLTLSYGLRWDYFGAAKYDDGLQYNWDAKTGDVIIDQSALSKVSTAYPTNINVVAGNPIQNPEKTNFAPRLGLAYQINDKTVIRGAYGVFTEAEGSYVNANGSGPFQISETYVNAIQDGSPLFSFPNPFLSINGTAPSQSVAGYSPTAENGYIQQFNLTLERQIKDMGFRIIYGGTRARGLNYSLNLNIPQPSTEAFSAARRPFPQFVSATMVETDGRTNYDALTVEALRRVGSVTFDAFWTLEHNQSDFLNLQNPYDHKFWNRTSYSPNQIATINASWQLPIGRHQKFLSNAPAVVNGVLGNWQLYFMCYFQSGLFFSPTYSGADPANVGASSGYPDRIANGNLPSGDRSLSRWFDTSAFRVPSLGKFGNSGVNILEGPGLSAQHVSIVKDFSILERLKLQLTLAVSNLFNHPNFLPPSGNISVPQGNIITSDVGPYSQLKGGPRSMEGRIRISF